VLYAMRVKTATAKHSVWAGVVALMLFLPIWTAWGPKAPLRVLPPLAQQNARKSNVLIETFSTDGLRSSPVSSWLVVLLALASDQPSPQSLRRLEHEYSFAAELDPAWAAKPLALTRHEGRTFLILKKPGSEPLDLVLERKQGHPLQAIS
jgi:hypothetical protein